jgi:large subunit ribosomal protein L30
MLRIKLVKSPIGNTPRNRATVAALGLRKMNKVVEHVDNPTIRGMVHHVKHLLQVEVVEGEPVRKSAPKRVASAVAEKPAKAPAKPKATKTEKAPAEETKPKRTTKPKSDTAKEK